MMKTLAYYLNEVSIEQQSANWYYVINLESLEIMQPIIDEACRRYTMQCCEALKLRCAENAECFVDDWYQGHINVDSILKTEIILP